MYCFTTSLIALNVLFKLEVLFSNSLDERFVLRNAVQVGNGRPARKRAILDPLDASLRRALGPRALERVRAAVMVVAQPAARPCGRLRHLGKW